MSTALSGMATTCISWNPHEVCVIVLCKSSRYYLTSTGITAGGRTIGDLFRKHARATNSSITDESLDVALRSDGDFEKQKQQFNLESRCHDFGIMCGGQRIIVTKLVCDLLDH